MRAKLGIFVTLAATILVFSVSTFAHHGNAAYDTGTSLTVKGTVTDFRFINPHCQIYFDAKNDKGEVEHWQGELPRPTNWAERVGPTQPEPRRSDHGNRICRERRRALIWIRKLIGPDGQALPLSED